MTRFRDVLNAMMKEKKGLKDATEDLDRSDNISDITGTNFLRISEERVSF